MLRFVTALFLVSVCEATLVPTISFEELVAKSDQIVTGRVTRSWMSWGTEHKFIWTRYDVAVEDTVKGASQNVVTVSEPGGALDGKIIRVAGAVNFIVGERVTLFLHTYPSGDKRTVGWTQGKFLVDAQDRIHPASLAGSQIAATVATESRRAESEAVPINRWTPLRSLDGITSAELRSRIRNVAH